jgi:putative copper resistance protein D
MTHQHLLLHVLVRWLEFTALVGVVGGLAYWQFVAPAISRDLSAEDRRAFRRGILLAVLLLGAVDATDMVFRSMMITGKPIGQVWPFIPTVILKTHFGWVWMSRFLLIAVLAAFFLFNRRKRELTRAARIASVAVAAGLCLTLSLSGHAADLGNFRLTVLADWVHVVAISSWVGGLFALRLHLRGALDRMKEKDRERCLPIQIEAFGRVAMASLAALFAGGLYNTFVQVNSAALLTGTSYGKILVGKWILVLGMLGLGGLSRFGILPLLQDPDRVRPKRILPRLGIGVLDAFVKNTKPAELKQWFFRLILIEALLGAGVLACSAWMTQLAPPHENERTMRTPGDTMDHSGHSM